MAWVDASFNTASNESPRQLHQGWLSELYMKFRLFPFIRYYSLTL